MIDLITFRKIKRSKVRVVYKSGYVQDFTCKNFKLTHSGGDLHSVTWEDAKPRPMHIGIDDIAAIWEL